MCAVKESSVLIDGDMRKVWNAITDPLKLTQWFVPDSTWEIPCFEVGEKVTFTLMPNAHDGLEEKEPMSLTIENIIPFMEFSLSADSQPKFLSFRLKEEKGIRVFISSEGYNESLENLKAFVEGKKLPALRK